MESSLKPCHCPACGGRDVPSRTYSRHNFHYTYPSGSESEPDYAIDMDVGDEDVKVSDMDITLDDSPDEYSDGLADVTDPDDSPRNHDRLYLDDVSDSESFASDEEFTSPDDLRSKAIQHALWFVESRYSSRASQAEVTRSLGVCRRLVEGISDNKDYLDTIPENFPQALSRTKSLVLDSDPLG